MREVTGKTGPGGRFRVSGLPPRRVSCWALRGEAEGLSEAAVRPPPLAVVPDGQEVVLRFREGVVMTGVVRDATGRAVPGVTVVLRADMELLGTARTDGEGRFRVAGLPGRKHRLSAVASLPDRGRADATLEDVVPGPEELELRFDVPVPAEKR
jgi:hypothetical protein